MALNHFVTQLPKFPTKLVSSISVKVRFTVKATISTYSTSTNYCYWCLQIRKLFFLALYAVTIFWKWMWYGLLNVFRKRKGFISPMLDRRNRLATNYSIEKCLNLVNSYSKVRYMDWCPSHLIYEVSENDHQFLTVKRNQVGLHKTSWAT